MDGNGRTFRLLQNTIPYQTHSYPFNINSKDRQEYYNLLEQASQEWLDMYDNLPSGLTNVEVLQRLYLTPRNKIRNFGNFVAENILEQFKKY
ncbi:MAG: hypothetical protein QXE31_02715 [Candidatus Woesearchaeota archaeon]